MSQNAARWIFSADFGADGEEASTGAGVRSQFGAVTSSSASAPASTPSGISPQDTSAMVPLSAIGVSSAAIAGAEAAAPLVASISTLASYLTSGYWADSGRSYRAFGHSNITVNLTGLSIAGEVSYARTALSAWARVANVTFTEVTSGGDIAFSDAGTGAASGSSVSGNTILSSSVTIGQSWYTGNGGAGGAINTLNSYGFQTYLHEIGHALGLGHQGNYNGSATYTTSNAVAGTNTYLNDSWQYSVMSYFSQTNYGGASYAYVASAMQADIFAIQSLYGAPVASQNHVFGYSSDVGSEFNLAVTDSFAIYADDGFAYLDGSGYGGSQSINFDAGTFSSLKGLSNNVGTATNTHLIGYIGGSGADTISFGSATNGARSASGGGGNDLFRNSSSSSSVSSITADGGAGVDVFDTLGLRAGVTFRRNSQSGNGWVLTGSNDYDVLSNIETARFLDGDVTLRQTRGDFNFGSVSGDTGSTSDFLVQSGGLIVDWTTQNGVVTGGNVLTSGLAGWTVVATGDVNSDGVSDVILQNGSGSFVSWIMQNGQVVGGNMLTTGATGWSVVGSGDFNNDGTVDLLLQNGGSIVNWIMGGGVVTSGNFITSGATGYRVVGVADLNGDGTSDILLQNASGNIVEWQMSNGVYAGGISLGAPAGWSVVGVGDFNGDGISDILLQNGGAVVDWLLDSTGHFSSGNLLTSTGAAGWTVVGTGDYNGDGIADVALRNSAGALVDWSLTPAGVISTTHLVTTGTTGYTIL